MVRVAANDHGSEQSIRFLEERVKRDPDDFIALNKLTGYYLSRLRETGIASWLDLAARAARGSLKAIPAEQNPGGLSLLAQIEFAAHDFVSARNHAEQLTQLEPRKWHPYLLLGDEFDGIRKLTPDYFYLVPGVGTQGGSLREISVKAMNKDVGLLVNVGRDIIFASKGEDFAEAAGEKARVYAKEMEGYLA